MGQRELLLARAEQALVTEEVLSVLRHDIRNKIAAAKQAGYYLRSKVEPTEVWNADRRVPAFFTLFDEQLSIAEKMLVESRALEALYTHTPRALDPSIVAEMAVEILSQPKGRVDRESFEAGSVVADEHELPIALRCLLENALEASDERGRVTFSGRVTPSEASYVFAIADTGPGLSRDAFRRLSRPLETTKTAARGLGLGMARRVAVRYGGALHLLERSGGATVELHVPLETRA